MCEAVKIRLVVSDTLLIEPPAYNNLTNILEQLDDVDSTHAESIIRIPQFCFENIR